MCEQENVVLCAASAYDEKYYLNPEFDGLPQMIKEELQIMCVLYTSQVGGILSLEYDDEGNLLLNVNYHEGDLLFDEIGSVLKIKEIQREKQELLEALELYYKAFILGDDIKELIQE